MILKYFLRFFVTLLFTIPCSLFAAAPHEKEITSLTLLLDWKPNTHHTGFYAAREKNFYTQNGISLKITNPTQTTTTSLVGTGKADFGITYANDLIYARNAHIPVVAIAGIVQTDTSCFVWRKSSGIQSVRDFEGKRYGGWGSPEETATLKFIMEKNGANFSKIKMLTTGVTDFLPATLKNVDFTWEYMGWGILNARLHHVEVGTYCPSEHFSQLRKPSPILITNENMMRNHPELVQKFLSATRMGYNIAIENPELAAQLLLKSVPELDKNLVEASAKFLAPLYKGNKKEWGDLDIPKLKNYARWMKDMGLIQQLPQSF